MITTFAKLRAPIAGLGKATLQFSKSFNKLSPDQFKASPLARTCGRANHLTIRSLIRSPIRAIVGSTLDGIGPSETVDVELYDDDGAFLLDDDGAYLTDS